MVEGVIAACESGSLAFFVLTGLNGILGLDNAGYGFGCADGDGRRGGGG